MATKVTFNPNGGVSYESDGEYGDAELFSYLGTKQRNQNELKLWAIGLVSWSAIAGILAFLFVSAKPRIVAPPSAPPAQQSLNHCI